MTGIGSSTGGVSRAASSSGSVQHAPHTVTMVNRANIIGVSCFGCDETGHHQTDCKK